MYFQSNTLADTPVCVKWAENTLKAAADEEKEHFVFFSDSLEGQKADAFQKICPGTWWHILVWVY